MVTCAGVGLHKGGTTRSSQGHLKVTARSNQPKSVKIVSHKLLKPTWPQHVGTPNTSQEFTGVIWGLEGNTPPPPE